MPDKVFVVGGTGNAGSEVAKKLASEGYIVLAASRNPGNVTVWHKKIQPYEFDYNKPETYSDILKEMDYVFMHSPPAHPDNHKLMIPFIDKAIESGVKKIIFMSAMGVEFDENLPLRATEIHLEKSGSDYVVFRPNWFFQVFNSQYAGQINKTGRLMLPAGNAQISFIDTRDIAACTNAALKDNSLDNKAYTLTGPMPHSIDEVVKEISEVSGKNIQYKSAEADEFRQYLLEAGVPPESVDIVDRLFTVVRHGHANKVTDEVEKISGNKPRSLRDYVKDYRKYWEL
ncbi:MAG: NAD(P)H-binding protein [Candidatus Kapaibacterium sp.]